MNTTRSCRQRDRERHELKQLFVSIYKNILIKKEITKREVRKNIVRIQFCATECFLLRLNISTKNDDFLHMKLFMCSRFDKITSA